MADHQLSRPFQIRQLLSPLIHLACKMYVAQSYQWPVDEVPKRLPIGLMRFDNIDRRTFKGSDKVSNVPLSLSVYADRPNDVHVLRAFIVHHGASLEAGQYTAGVFCKGRWWHCYDVHAEYLSLPRPSGSGADTSIDAIFQGFV
jgi:ubiquitin C-terminal hydrolase